jgi:peptidoglycan-associated lipoprotein
MEVGMRRFIIMLACGMLWSAAALAQSASAASSDQQAGSISSAKSNPAQQPAVEENLKDVHFDFDRAELTDSDRQVIQANANWLKANDGVSVSIAGDADDRGNIIYNLLLSQRRAEATRDALIAAGVPGDRIEFATGWGKLYPICSQADESCWSQNRRAHFSAGTDLQNHTVAQEPKSLPIIACATLDCP